MPPPKAVFHGQASIRASCERCRFQKLKCTGPTGRDGDGPCQRCARARVDCVFGRRRPISRTSESKNQSEATSNSQSIATFASLPTPSPMSITPAIAIPNGPRIERTGGSTIYDMHNWDTVQLQDVMDKAADFAHHLDTYDNMEANAISDMFLFDPDPESVEQAAPNSPASWYIKRPPGVTESISDNKNHKNGLVQSLLALLSEMQEGLRMLQEGSWQLDSTCGLDNYPIGTVLHLSQQFSTLVGPCLDRLTLSCNDRATPSPGVDGTLADSLTMTLILSAYMSLMRLYSVALAQFQAHLAQISPQEQVLTPDSLSPTLQLGQLPCATTAHGLGRIHVALCMLQESLNSVEEQLGKGGEIARDMVMALLRKESHMSTGNSQDGRSGLSRQVTDMKGQLREKMSL